MANFFEQFNEWYKALDKNQRLELITAAKKDYEKLEKVAHQYGGSDILQEVVNYIIDQLSNSENFIAIEAEIDSTIGECIVSHAKSKCITKLKLSEDIEIINQIHDNEELKSYCKYIIENLILSSKNPNIIPPFNSEWEHSLVRFVGNICINFVYNFDSFEDNVERFSKEFKVDSSKIRAILSIVNENRTKLFQKFVLQQVFEQQAEISKLKKLLLPILENKN
ncbi:MAG: hypothetical protein KAX49_05640 [Halanaerobiales bacterium]|nr:hypothetical protein [Halanaerobiales bacterium]